MSWLGCPPGCAPEGGKAAEGDDPHPFYGLRNFHLLYQVPLSFPPALHLSRNYFNPAWSGLRRLKNVVCLLEWCPDADASAVRLVTDDEHKAQVQLNDVQQATIFKAHALLKDENGRLTRERLEDVFAAATSAPVHADLLAKLWEEYGCGGQGVTAAGLQEILITGRLYPTHHGRYWVAVSLAEAETLRRILHLRQRRSLLSGTVSFANCAKGGCELALHLSQAGALGLPGSTLLDASSGWRTSETGATHHEMAVALGCYRFFDGDMHYARATLAKLIRALHMASIHDREQFFASSIGARRRMERKWQETPLAAVFSIADEWINLKQNAQAAFVRLALKRRDLTPWEAFVAFDADNNSRLSPSELYGALRWLEVPELTAEDVVDFFELADANRDGMIEYAEFMSLFEEDGKPPPASGAAPLDQDVFAEEEEEESAAGLPQPSPARRAREPPPKIEPYGADELRTIIVSRRRRELERQRQELARRSAQQADMDIKLFREELQASARRKGGSNPRIYLMSSLADEQVLKAYGGGNGAALRRMVVFSFESNSTPLRTSVSGRSKYVPVLIDDVRKNLLAPKCKNGHMCSGLGGVRGRRWGSCALCDRYTEAKKSCRICYYFLCARCFQAYEDEQVKERSEPAGKHTFIRCDAASDITLHIPPPSVDPTSPPEFQSDITFRAPVTSTPTRSGADPLPEGTSPGERDQVKTASVVGPGEIDFQWAQFSPRDKAVAGMDVVLCAPEKADADIENADQLVGKMAVVYRCTPRSERECTFQKKTERLIAAGAHGVIIINTGDDLFEAPPADEGYSAAIPVVMIKAKDATALLASGNSSCLGKPALAALGADFSITIELKLHSLPANGQIAALVRFSPPDFSQVSMCGERGACVRVSGAMSVE